MLPYKEFFFRQPLDCSNVSNQIKMLDRVIDAFELALVNETIDDLDEVTSIQDQMFHICSKQTGTRISNIGKYSPPCTKYLSTSDYAPEDDELVMMDVQESNLNWLEIASNQNLEEISTFLAKNPYNRSQCLFPLLETWKEVSLVCFMSRKLRI
jgi:hypothetical protein